MKSKVTQVTCIKCKREMPRFCIRSHGVCISCCDDHVGKASQIAKEIEDKR